LITLLKRLVVAIGTEYNVAGEFWAPPGADLEEGV